MKKIILSVALLVIIVGGLFIGSIFIEKPQQVKDGVFKLNTFDKLVLEKFDNIIDVYEADGKAVLEVQKDKETYILVEGIRQINVNERFYELCGTAQSVIINNKKASIYMDIMKGGSHIAYDGKLSEKYFRVDNLANINNKLAYTAIKFDADYYNSVVVYDNTTSEEYSGTSCLFDVGGKLAYVAYDNGKCFVVFDGNKSEEYQSDWFCVWGDEIYNINGKIAYRATNDNWRGSFIVYDNNKVSIDGKLLFFRYQNGLIMIIVEKNNKTEVYSKKV